MAVLTAGTASGPGGRRIRAAEQGGQVAHRDHGGRGEAATELENFVHAIESEQIQLEHQVRTLGEVLTAYIEHCRRIGRRQATVESYEMVAKRITMEMKETAIDIPHRHDFDEFYGGLGKTLVPTPSDRRTPSSTRHSTRP